MSKLILRDYQELSINGLREGFAAGHRSQMLYLPTGAGKTEVAISMLAAAEQKGHRAAMVMDRRVLCDQTSQRLDKYNIDHGVLMAGHWRYLTYKSIQICSAQTLEKRGSFPNLKLLVVDEAHNTRRSTVDFIKNNPGIKVVGLSASPFVKGLGSTYSNVISKTTTKQLVDMGNLARLRVFIAKEIDMTGAKKVGGEWSQAEAGARGIQITGDIVSEWIKKTHEIFGGPRKTIVFCAGVAHGQDLSAKFKEAGYNFVSISYRDDEDAKQEILREFSKPDSAITGLIATDILTKGFDCPDVMIGISARPFTKSFSSHVQQLGRVMRSHPCKEFAVWLDHSGNFLRFKDQWEDLYHNGVSALDDGAEKPKKEPTKEEKEAAKCPKCGELWQTNSDTGQHCGHVRVRRNQVVSVPGEMQEIKLGKAVAARNKRDLWNQLCTYVKEHGKKPGMAFHLYQDIAGDVPPFKFEAALDVPVSRVVENEIRRRNIAFAKGCKRRATA
ncbi:DEAD/DEAH box helicase [Methylobacter luteus]|uniref:DEAD/DEAH box helicase n=1 Tax=Methylobacter luteus TaxID=415 RepID=UPI0004091347|nr:DEAD/DEAH box helicase family protein [Methylobacter luteus]